MDLSRSACDTYLIEFKFKLDMDTSKYSHVLSFGRLNFLSSQSFRTGITHVTNKVLELELAQRLDFGRCGTAGICKRCGHLLHAKLFLLLRNEYLCKVSRVEIECKKSRYK